MHLGVVHRDGLADLLQDGGLAGLGRAHDEAALALADGAHDVDGAAGDGVLAVLHLELLVGVDGREVGELRAGARDLRVHAVDALDLREAGELVVGAHGTERALDEVARAQARGADEVRGHEGVVAARHVAVRADVAVALVRDVEDARDVAEALGAGGGGVDGLDEFGLLHAGDVDVELLRALAQLRDLHGREVVARERGLGGREAVVAVLAVLLAVAAVVAVVTVVVAVRVLAALRVRAAVVLLALARGVLALGGRLLVGSGRGGSLRGRGLGRSVACGGSLRGGVGRGGIRAHGSSARRIPRRGGLRGSGSSCGLLRLDERLGLAAATVRAERGVDERRGGILRGSGSGGRGLGVMLRGGGVCARIRLGERALGTGGGAALAAHDGGLGHLRQGACLRGLGRERRRRGVRGARGVRGIRRGRRIGLLGSRRARALPRRARGLLPRLLLRSGLLPFRALRRPARARGAARLLLRGGRGGLGVHRFGGVRRFVSHYACSTFFQSSMNSAKPRSVSGCCTAFFSALNGTVAMSQPASAASVT